VSLFLNSSFITHNSSLTKFIISEALIHNFNGFSRGKWICFVEKIGINMKNVIDQERLFCYYNSIKNVCSEGGYIYE